MTKQRFFQPSSEPTIMTVCTWATTPNAADFSGKRIRVTDIGIGGVDFISNGTRWVPTNEHFKLDYFAISLVRAPTLTSVSATGEIVLGTAVNVRFAKCFMYFAAGQLFSDGGGNAAGFYYTEMSDTTNAIVYNDTYTPAAGTRPTVPTTPTAFSGKTGATGGSLAGATGVITAFTTTVPGGVLGPRGTVITKAMIETTNSAGSKPCTIVFGGTTICSQALTTSANIYGENIIRNRATNEQRCSAGFHNGTNNNIVNTASVDTDNDVTMSITFRAAVATDVVAISAVYIDVGVFI